MTFSVAVIKFGGCFASRPPPPPDPWHPLDGEISFGKIPFGGNGVFSRHRAFPCRGALNASSVLGENREFSTLAFAVNGNMLVNVTFLFGCVGKDFLFSQVVPECSKAQRAEFSRVWRALSNKSGELSKNILCRGANMISNLFMFCVNVCFLPPSPLSCNPQSVVPPTPPRRLPFS